MEFQTATIRVCFEENVIFMFYHISFFTRIEAVRHFGSLQMFKIIKYCTCRN